MPELAKVFDGKKFMWDGAVYEDRPQAEQAKASYEGQAFETRIVEEEGKCLVYSRRVAAQQTVTEGSSSP